MPSYRQRVTSEIQARALRIQKDLADKQECRQKMAMSIEECYRAGFQRGTDDRIDKYTGAIECQSLGNDYAYSEEYRKGYQAAYFKSV